MRLRSHVVRTTVALLLAADVVSARTRSGGSEDTDFAFCFLAAVYAMLFGVWVKRARSKNGTSRSYVLSDSTPAGSLRTPLPMDALQDLDPCFSVPLFLEFLGLLYVRVHLQRGKGRLDPLAPYVAKNLLAQIQAQRPVEMDEVSNVLVATAGIVSIDFEPQTRMVVNFLASYRETVSSQEVSYQAQERWTLSRDRGVRSKPPERIVVLGCPGCGSPETPRTDGSCASCGRVVRDGRFDWFVTGMKTLKKIPSPPPDLSGGRTTGAELPTVYSHTLKEDSRAFRARHPEFEFNHFAAFVARSFRTLKEAWSNQAWERARPIEADHLFSMHRYWVEQYKSAGMMNRIEDIHVMKIVSVKFEQDAYYEGITVRIGASCLDYTVDGHDQVVAGSRTARCILSEYWTFMRRIGHERKAAIADGGCPSCGAPFRVDMAGVCEYCRAKLTNGDFGWVAYATESAARYGG